MKAEKIQFNFFILVTKREIANQSEIDHVRICIVCMAGIIPFLAISLDQIYYYIFLNFLGVLPHEYIFYLLDYFTYFTEDLCLLLLCSDFRRMFFIFSICGRNRRNVIVPAEQMIPLPLPQMVEESGEQIPRV